MSRFDSNWYWFAQDVGDLNRLQLTFQASQSMLSRVELQLYQQGGEAMCWYENY